MKRFIALLLAICMTALALCACGSAKREGTYTLMVYMVGSDLESKHMAASNDISEMLDSGLKLDDVNLLIYTGGTDMWYYDIPSDANMTCLLNKDEDGEPYLQELARTEKLLNMGDSATLASFLNYSCENFPADRYGLICWDHGNGPLIGFGNDIRFDNDKLSAEELKSALDASPFKEDKKLDFIGFDACLMSSIEVADVLNNHAKYMIASQEKSPATAGIIPSSAF